ncbi:hypothetical protein FGG08_006656 [Glutinoglossum americanum]|uniref:Uncharacterized protein n=1 Tax=Glutinoglossum americanum TaxID=1670608 RepID=A0A9P8HXV5_9PEZI|nr:hypothetical protein FGG08_006656 [Glutinoglossum americanum]
MRVVSPPKLLGVAIVFFGVCSTCLAAAKNYASILALRVLIGAGQAFVQVGSLYLSIWYKRNEVATRAGETIPPILKEKVWKAMTADCGLIAYGVDKNLRHTGTFLSWQWLFITEGVSTIAVGAFLFFSLPPFPEQLVEKASWIFNPEEIRIAVQRTIEANNHPNARIVRRQLWAGLRDPKAYFTSMIHGAFVLGISSISNFLPTFILVFGFGRRLYPGAILNVVWININHGGYTKRSTAWAMAQVTGNSYGIIGTQVYRHPPRFLVGHGTLLGSLALAMGAVVANYLWMRNENRKKEEVAMWWRDQGQENPDKERTFEELLDYHPDFKYFL